MKKEKGGNVNLDNRNVFKPKKHIGLMNNEKGVGDYIRNLIMKDRKGLADVIVMLIMIVLVLVAIGILWVVIRGQIESGTEDIELSASCLEVDLDIIQMACGGASNDVCNVTVERNAGGDDIGGIKLIFTNEEGEGNFIHDVSGNIEALGRVTETDVNTGLTNTTDVEVVPYFVNSAGTENLCGVADSFPN